MSDYTDDAIPTHPSDLACIDFVNSVFTDYLGRGPQTDRLTSGDWQQWFLARHDLTPDDGAPPLAELRRLRGHVRTALDTWARQSPPSPREVRSLDEWVRRAPIQLRVVRQDGAIALRPEPLERDWSWVMSAVAASAVDLMVTGDPSRLKTCANPACSWVFYDATINHSRQYCSTTPCGSLMRVRKFRSRS